jgi:predicted PurR-regulated permease PerM
MDTHLLGTHTTETNPKGSDAPPTLALPQDLKTLLLLGIFGLLFFYALYLLGELIVPIIFAFMLSLALRPTMDFLTRLHIPKFVAGLAIVLIGAGCLLGATYLLAGPTSAWLEKAPASLTTLQTRLASLIEVTDKIQRAGKEVEKISTDPKTPRLR